MRKPPKTPPAATARPPMGECRALNHASRPRSKTERESQSPRECGDMACPLPPGETHSVGRAPGGSAIVLTRRSRSFPESVTLTCAGAGAGKCSSLLCSCCTAANARLVCSHPQWSALRQLARQSQCRILKLMKIGQNFCAPVNTIVRTSGLCAVFSPLKCCRPFQNMVNVVLWLPQAHDW